MQALAFILYSPLQSWGDLAVGEVRNTFRYPSKSALVGFLSAALGYDRIEDEQKILALNSALKFAVRLDGNDRVLAEYHTTQVPSAKKGISYRTRRNECSARELNTILSTREYLCDAVFSIFCFAKEDLLQELERKLINPERTLYLGRKSCPLAVPCLPKLIEGVSLNAIHSQYALPDEVKKWVPQKQSGEATRIYWEDGIEPGLDIAKTFTKHDDIISRARWQFGTRSEHMANTVMP